MRRSSGILILLWALSACHSSGNPQPPPPPQPRAFVPVGYEISITDDPTSLVASHLEDLLSHGVVRGIESIITLNRAPVTVAGSSIQRSACAVDLSVPSGRRFGDDPQDTGLADQPRSPAANEVYLTDWFATVLGVGTSDQVTIDGSTFTVAAVLPDGSLTQACPVLVSEYSLSQDKRAHQVQWVQMANDARSTPADVVRSAILDTAARFDATITVHAFPEVLTDRSAR